MWARSWESWVAVLFWKLKANDHTLGAGGMEKGCCICELLQWNVLVLGSLSSSLPPYSGRVDLSCLCTHFSHQCSAFGRRRMQTLEEGKLKTDCNRSFLTAHFSIEDVSSFPSSLISRSPLCSNFATVCYGFPFFLYLLDSQQQMLVIFAKNV